jgi:Xaa-Pro aminopeptidase
MHALDPASRPATRRPFEPSAVLRRAVLQLVALTLPSVALAQEAHRHQVDFPPAEFAERRARVFAEIGDDAMALIQGAPNIRGFLRFRQTNSFYYLSGVEVPHAYLLLDGRSDRTTLYLPHRDARRERGEGKVLSAEDAELVVELTGVDRVEPLERLGRDLMGPLLRPPAPALYTMLSPAEGAAQSRDELLIGMASEVADPWGGQPSREGWFVQQLGLRYPQFEIRDLTPILDRLRIVKSEREIALVRRASELAGLGLMEAMRSAQPGAWEYQLDAAARYVFLIHGAQGEGYRSITGTGSNAYFGHYHRNDAQLRDGELVLMDYAPDYRYYTSDVARVFPVNGRFSPEQRQLYGFVHRYFDVLMDVLRPGVSADQVMDEAAARMRSVFKATAWSKPSYRQAAEEMLAFRGHLSHPVGLAVHDVGNYRARSLEPGVVLALDPMLWVHDEKLYVRIEDVVVINEDGAENFTWFVPRSIDAIEQLMREDGVLQKVPTGPDTFVRSPR